MARLQATITQAGMDAPVRVPLNGIDLSWRINARGEASAEVETEWLRRSGLLDQNLEEGHWLHFRDRRLGPWSGVIQQVVDDLATGTTEIAAETFEALFDKRLVRKEYDAPSSNAGGLARKAIAEVSKGGSVYIKGYRVGITGLADVVGRYEQLVDFIDQMAALAGAEWRVTWDRYFEFAARLGRDRSAEVVLLYPRDIGPQSRIIRDARPRANRLVAMSGVEEYARKTAVAVEDAPSLMTGTLREESIVFPYLIKQSALIPAAKKELARLARLGRAATLDVLDTNGAWAMVREGDTVRLRVPSSGVRRNLRVMTRAWSSESDRLTVSGELSA